MTYTPNSSQNREKLIQAYRTPVRSEESCGYHGTSIEVLETILKTSKQPGSAYIRKHKDISGQVRAGDVFVFPIEEKTPNDLMLMGCGDEEKIVYEGAKSYAKQVAEHHTFSEKLGIPIQSRDIGIYAPGDLIFFLNNYKPGNKSQNQEIRPVHEYLLQTHSQEAIDKAYASTQEQEGIIISYKETIFNEEKEPLPGNDFGDMRIQNVTIDDICGLEAIGKESKRRVEELLQIKHK